MTQTAEPETVSLLFVSGSLQRVSANRALLDTATRCTALVGDLVDAARRVRAASRTTDSAQPRR